jgi:hypothetical protein
VRRALAPVALIPAGLVLALSACDSGDKREPAAAAASAARPAAAVAAVNGEIGTPVKDRVATLGLLNKRNNLTQDLVMKTGEARRIGNVIVTLATCERTLPWESPAEVGAFVQVNVDENAGNGSSPKWKRVFSGWLFRNSPSLNVVEHPVYDVWVKDCAMKFPGEEETPAPPASATSAAKPSGSASTAPAAPEPSPSATPSPAPAASPDSDG